MISLMFRAPGGIEQLRKFSTFRISSHATKTDYRMVLKGNRDQVRPEIASANEYLGLSMFLFTV